jgi:cytochrome c
MPLPLAVIAISAVTLLSGWPGAAAAPAPGSIERGRALLAQYQCGSCHTIPGVTAARGQVAAPLAQWRKRSYIAGRLPNRPEVLAQWIAAPQSLVPGTPMPSMGVSAADAQAMAAYLNSLE